MTRQREIAAYTQGWEDARMERDYNPGRMEPPAPTLAEELRAWLKSQYTCAILEGQWDRLDALADRAEQIEKERDDALAAAKTWREQDENDCEMYMEELASARAEVERLTKSVIDNITLPMPPGDIPGTALPIHRTRRSKSKETLAGSLPDPADVPAGSAWLVEVEGEQRLAVKGNDALCPWAVVSPAGAMTFLANPCVSLISRLVPAPRVITDPDELYELRDDTVILSEEREGIPWQRHEGIWFSAWAPSRSSDEITLPVTVLWEGEK